MKSWIIRLINHAVLLYTSTAVAADALGTNVITEDDNLTKSIKKQ